MLVKTLMSHPVTTVREETMVGDALELIKKKNIRRLPVVDEEGRLIGLTTEWDLLKIFPLKPNNSFETKLISRTPIKNLMRTDPMTVSPEETIESAAVTMQCNKIGCLPVVDRGKVVGLISLTDILTAFIDAMGLEKSSVRITIKFSKRMGFLAELIQLIDGMGIIVDNMVTINDEIVLKIKDIKTEELLQTLKEEKYKVTHIAYIDGTEDIHK